MRIAFIRRFVGDSGEFVRILNKYCVQEMYFGTAVSRKQGKSQKEKDTSCYIAKLLRRVAKVWYPYAMLFYIRNNLCRLVLINRWILIKLGSVDVNLLYYLRIMFLARLEQKIL